MVIPRASTSWSSRLFNQSRQATRGINRTRTWQHAQRRSYASEGSHGSQKSALGGDTPWAIGSLVVTVPSLYYLSGPQINKARYGSVHGPGGGHGEHGAHGEEHEDEEHDGGEEDGTSESEAAEEGKSENVKNEEKPDDSDSDDDGKDTPDTSDDEGPENVAHETEGGGNVEGVQFKGATSGGTEEGQQGDTRKHIPDAKGFNKKRIESHYGKKEGEAQNPEQDPNDKDLGAASKPAGDHNTMSGKQEGLSNTDTKHSTDLSNSPDKSTKGEGVVETAKLKGTVDPNRPMA